MAISKEQWDYITYFTPEEVRKANGNPDTLDFELVLRYNKFRELIERPVHFVYNGLNSGGHVSKFHKNGQAGDCYLDPKDGKVNIHKVIMCALQAGFTGIGIYWNGKCFSFHFDIRPRYKGWRATKKYLDENNKKWEWNYKQLLHNSFFKG